MSTHGKGATDRWLQELTALAGGVENESDRGQFLQRVHSAVANLKHDNIADLVGLILDTGAWRSYTYPNGEHYEFRAREFDYFLAQQDIDPRMVRDAASYAEDGELRALLVESSLDVVNEDRRSVEEITEAYPKLRPWLEKYGLRVLGPKTAYENPAARERVKAGKTAEPFRARWYFPDPDPTAMAKTIAARLRERPEVLEALVEEMADTLPWAHNVNSIVNSERSCLECGGPFTSKTTRAKYCGDSCRNNAANKRKRQA